MQFENLESFVPGASLECGGLTPLYSRAERATKMRRSAPDQSGATAALQGGA